MGALSPEDLAADHAMATLAGSVRFLLEMTPVNADDVRAKFLAHPEVDPVFEYRKLDADPNVLDAQVAALPLDDVADATLAALLRNRQREMSLRIEMLRARNTPDFLQLSIAQYGAVQPGLVSCAEDLLRRLPSGRLEYDSVNAETFLAAAQAEIDYYRSIDPDVGIHAEIRDDISGVLVDGNMLLISNNAAVAAPRVNALLQHEVGTHLVTQVNGMAQPIRMLGSGLAHYDETQEGLAVLAEIACGGLTATRLRQLAARVVAVQSLVGGASFRRDAPPAHRSRSARRKRLRRRDAGVPGRRLHQGCDLPARATRATASMWPTAARWTCSFSASSRWRICRSWRTSPRADCSPRRGSCPGTSPTRGRRQAAECRPHGRPGDTRQRVSARRRSPYRSHRPRPST